MQTLGKIRPSYIKRIAKNLAERYSNAFTKDFDENKKLVEKYTNVESKRVRNRIAGYLVSIVKSSQFEYVSPEEEEFPEDYEEYEVKVTAEEETTEEMKETAEEEETTEEMKETAEEEETTEEENIEG